MSEYETLEEEVRDFGNRSYLQVARKRVRDGDDATEFLVVTRGFYDDDDTRRWTKFVTIPGDDEELVGFVGRALVQLGGTEDALEDLTPEAETS